MSIFVISAVVALYSLLVFYCYCYFCMLFFFCIFHFNNSSFCDGIAVETAFFVCLLFDSATAVNIRENFCVEIYAYRERKKKHLMVCLGKRCAITGTTTEQLMRIVENIAAKSFSFISLSLSKE